MAQPSPSYSQWVLRAPGPQWALESQGVYHYKRCPAGHSSFEAVPVFESFCSWTDSSRPGARWVRSERNAMQMPVGVMLQVESESTSLHQGRADFSLQGKGATESAQARYEWGSGVLETSRLNPLNGRSEEKVFLSNDGLVLPLMRVYLGPVLQAISRRVPMAAPVVVPSFGDPKGGTVFQPTLETRRVERLLAPMASIDAMEDLEGAEALGFYGGPYASGSVFWVCKETGALLRYLFELPNGERWWVERREGEEGPGAPGLTHGATQS